MKGIIFSILLAILNYLILFICIHLLNNLEYGSAIAFCIITSIDLGILYSNIK